MLRPSIARPISEPLVFKKGLLPEGFPEVGNKIKIEGTVFVDAVTHRRRRSGDNFNVFRHFKKKLTSPHCLENFKGIFETSLYRVA